MKSRRRPPPVVPAYIDALLKLYAENALPVGVCSVTIRHDDWCDLLHGRGPCNCDPEVEPPERVQ